jgi:hypothetical protein
MMSNRTLNRNKDAITDNVFEQFLYMAVMPLSILAFIAFAFMFY